ncbi:MAG TPA: DoxX family protein [Polyangia bacterium]|nr:DoxX family protein [Polyangia bacterium]
MTTTTIESNLDRFVSIPTVHQHASEKTVAIAQTAPVSKKALWAGRCISGLAVLFLAFDATVKVLQLPPAVQGTVELGYPVGVIFGLGVLQLALLLIYLMPRTAVLGAVLWTGYLGGAVATHVRVGHPWLSHILFPIYVAALIWGGLWLRRQGVRALFSLRRAFADR